MLTIACAGFPIPATRYFKEYSFVEIQDTHLAAPGGGSVRRWRREAPPGFVFAMVAPKEVGAEGYKHTPTVDAALSAFEGVGKELGAAIAVFTSPPDFAENKANKAAVKEFLRSLEGRFGRLVWEAPIDWNAETARSLAEDAGAIPAIDPLRSGTTTAPFAYYRLPGPAGYKSRYEDAAMDKLAGIVAAAKNKDAIYVFANIDMVADSKRLAKAIKL